jgi:hypothetical protein
MGDVVVLSTVKGRSNIHADVAIPALAALRLTLQWTPQRAGGVVTNTKSYRTANQPTVRRLESEMPESEC